MVAKRIKICYCYWCFDYIKPKRFDSTILDKKDFSIIMKSLKSGDLFAIYTYYAFHNYF